MCTKTKDLHEGKTLLFFFGVVNQTL